MCAIFISFGNELKKAILKFRGALEFQNCLQRKLRLNL